MSEPIIKLTAANLAALLCARICHDLVSPVGALSAALEVFDDDDNLDMRDDAMDLIKLSAGQASAKLQFLRIAFGAGGSAPGVISSTELEKLVLGVYGSGKANLHWQVSADGLDKQAARILLNLSMLSVMAVPRGGDITVSTAQENNATQINIACKGPKARLDPIVVKTLAGGAPEDGFDGRNIQPFYTGMIARENGGSVQAEIDDATEEPTITFSANLPMLPA